MVLFYYYSVRFYLFIFMASLYQTYNSSFSYNSEYTSYDGAILIEDAQIDYSNTTFSPLLTINVKDQSSSDLLVLAQDPSAESSTEIFSKDSSSLSLTSSGDENDSISTVDKVENQTGDGSQIIVVTSEF